LCTAVIRFRINYYSGEANNLAFFILNQGKNEGEVEKLEKLEKLYLALLLKTPIISIG